MITHVQLLALGFTPEAIRHRLASGRLHAVHHGVYAVGRPELTDLGRWKAATLAVRGSVLSHLDAARLHGIIETVPGRRIEVSICDRGGAARRPGLLVHRRRPGVLAAGAVRRGIPLTDPADTVIDIAPRLSVSALTRAINEADKLELVTAAELCERAAANPRRPGAVRVRALVEQAGFVLTESELEDRFLPLADAAGLPVPQTGAMVSGYKADFFWPELRLVVETDGGRFHRTPLQQTRDRRRDQAHLANGLTPLRFTHGQIRFAPEEVVEVLGRIATRLSDQLSSNRAAAPGRGS